MIVIKRERNILTIKRNEGYDMALDQNGYTVCLACRRKKFISDLTTCSGCGRYVCRSCSKKLSFLEGDYCPKCHERFKKANGGKG